MAFAQGLTSNVQGILDGDAVQRWIDAEVDLSAPLLVPLVFTVTNLDRQRPEFFYRLPFTPSDAAREAAIARLRVAVGAIADNAPIDVGRALARGVYTVLVDPIVPAREAYANALTIAVGSLGIAQERIFQASLRGAISTRSSTPISSRCGRPSNYRSRPSSSTGKKRSMRRTRRDSPTSRTGGRRSLRRSEPV